jgi:hypothetical protein
MCCFAGTKPPVNSVMKQARELDYDLVESEHRALLQVIRDSQSESKQEGAPLDKLHIRVQYPKALDTEGGGGAGAGLGPGLPPASLVPLSQGIGAGGGGPDGPWVKILVRLYLSYSADKPASNVSISIDCPSFAHVVPKNVVLDKVHGVRNTPVLVKLCFYATRTCLPNSLDAVVSACYTSHTGEHRVTSLPLVRA